MNLLGFRRFVVSVQDFKLQTFDYKVEKSSNEGTGPLSVDLNSDKGVDGSSL